MFVAFLIVLATVVEISVSAIYFRRQRLLEIAKTRIRDLTPEELVKAKERAKELGLGD
jgi:hypothetical protein